jgi:hypothetical protein
MTEVLPRVMTATHAAGAGSCPGRTAPRPQRTARNPGHVAPVRPGGVRYSDEMVRSLPGEVVEEEAWIDRIDQNGRRFTFDRDSFLEFIDSPEPRGLGTTKDAIREYLPDSTPLRIRFEALAERKAGNPHGTPETPKDESGRFARLFRGVWQRLPLGVRRALMRHGRNSLCPGFIVNPWIKPDRSWGGGVAGRGLRGEKSVARNHGHEISTTVAAEWEFPSLGYYKAFVRSRGISAKW